MNPRLLVAGIDPRYREWLRNHLDVLLPDAAVTALDPQEFQVRSATLTRQGCDLVLLIAQFGDNPDDPQSQGLEWLRQLRDQKAFPPVIAIAEDGNELIAVRAMQIGAADYLPQRLVTPERLGTAVRLALRRVEMEAAAAAIEDTSAEAHNARALHDPIPGYVIRKTIGQSDKAMVYLASSDGLEQDVALKVTRGGEDSAEAQVFAREYAALSAIRHPSVVTIHDYGIHEGREYLAMEYFPRGDLKGRLQRGILEADALRYLEQIAHALQVVHGARLLHRDLKPPNLMLREDDTLVMIDFGLARNLTGNSASTRAGVLRGSPYYMSPEQALGEELDHRTDLYSLGVVFYEMLSSRKPYTGISAIEVLQQHVNAPLPQLPSSQAHLQPLLDGLMAKARDNRFATAGEAAEAIAGMRALRKTAARR